MTRTKTLIPLILLATGLALSACVVAPAPGYYSGGPSYYGSGYYGPSVGFYYGGGRGWDRDRDRDRGGRDWDRR